MTRIYTDTIVQDSKLDKLVQMAKPLCLQIPRNKKHVSLIMRKGKLLSIGTNAFKGHPMATKIGYRFGEQHSELNALLKCSERDKLTLINVRFNKHGLIRMARPCPLCLSWCAGIFDNIYYTCPMGKIRKVDLTLHQ